MEYQTYDATYKVTRNVIARSAFQMHQKRERKIIAHFLCIYMPFSFWKQSDFQQSHFFYEMTVFLLTISMDVVYTKGFFLKGRV